MYLAKNKDSEYYQKVVGESHNERMYKVYIKDKMYIMGESHNGRIKEAENKRM